MTNYLTTPKAFIFEQEQEIAEMRAVLKSKDSVLAGNRLRMEQFATKAVKAANMMRNAATQLVALDTMLRQEEAKPVPDQAQIAKLVTQIQRQASTLAAHEKAYNGHIEQVLTAQSEIRNVRCP